MQIRKELALRFVVSALVLVPTLWPATVEARGRRGHGRSVVFVRGAYYYPFLNAYAWYPYPLGLYPPLPPYAAGYARPSAVRLQVTPRDAEVYVDGYLAGTVDDFDGFFQRLQLPPGQHDIVVYRDGYRSVRQSMYLTPGSTYKLHDTMVPLTPGESAEPRPLPSNPGPMPANAPPQQMPSGPGPQAGQKSRFGTLAIRVQPASADVLIDGERWRGPEGQDRLAVQISEGTHRIEIRKEGYETFSTEVHVRGEETNTLNVSLLPSERQ